MAIGNHEFPGKAREQPNGGGWEPVAACHAWQIALICQKGRKWEYGAQSGSPVQGQSR